MREDLQLGYNILYGTGDTVKRAVSGLCAIVRSAHESYNVEFIAGVNIKEDAKNAFHAVREVMLTEKTEPLP